MHADALRDLLGRADATPDYDRHRAEVTEALLTATQNITYADERPQLRTILDELSRYEREIAAARALHAAAGAEAGRREEALRRVREADRVLRDRLLTAADMLDAINSKHLKDVYNLQKSWGLLAQTVVFVAGLALVGALVWAQLYLRQKFRRLSNPPLVLATVVAVGFVGFTMYELIVGRLVLKTAKEDAFGSIHLVWQARADGYDALAAARLRLLEADRERAAAAAEQFEKAVDRIGHRPPELDAKAMVDQVKDLKIPKGFRGYLADVLRNVTFPGEGKAAVAAVEAFVGFVEAERQVLANETGPGTLTWAAARFDESLDGVLAVNQREFDKATRHGSVVLRWCEYLNPLAMAGVFLLTALGLYPRLREYAI
jgi:hypothetical protein